MIYKKRKAIIITGATGSGKSKYAVDLANKINGVIINCDSMQIYKQIPILSAQPSHKDIKKISHLMYGYIDIFNGVIDNNVYSVGDYLLELRKELQFVVDKQSGKIPIIVGGTMLYVESIINGLSNIPEIDVKLRFEIREKYKNKVARELFEELQKIDRNYALIVDKCNYQRLLRGLEVKIATGKSITDFWKEKKKNFFTDNYDIEKFLIVRKREELYRNINLRFNKMIEDGVINEVQKIYNDCIKKNIDKQKLPKAIGLHKIFDYIEGIISLETAVEKIKQESRNYAKRQMIWFRKRCNNFKNIEL